MIDSHPKQASSSKKAESILYLKRGIAQGKHWYIALLESIALWTAAEETYEGRHYQYLIAGQAFDWLLLAERLSDEVRDLIPENERIDLLFGKAPVKLSKEEFKSLVGNEKFEAHLNYFYGIVVEQALHVVVEAELEKELHGNTRRKSPGVDPFQRIYNCSESTLLERFREEKGLSHSDRMTFPESKEFTYWLFKYRIENCDSSRMASDTKKALQQLDQLRERDSLIWW